MRSETNITLHIITIAVFIVIIFFTYGSYLEEKTIEKQMDYVTDDLIGNIKVLAPDLSLVLKQKLSNIKPPDMRAADQAVQEHNNTIKTNTSITIGVSALFFILFVGLMIWYYELDGGKILLHNLLALIVVGLTYFMFSSFIVYNYRSAEPNMVKRSILETLKDFSK
jgi:hypothetical protein